MNNRNLIAANKGKEYADEFTPHYTVGSANQQDKSGLIGTLATAKYELDQSQMGRIDQMVGLPPRKPKSPEQIAQGTKLTEDYRAAKANAGAADKR